MCNLRCLILKNRVIGSGTFGEALTTPLFFVSFWTLNHFNGTLSLIHLFLSEQYYREGAWLIPPYFPCTWMHDHVFGGYPCKAHINFSTASRPNACLFTLSCLICKSLLIALKMAMVANVTCRKIMFILVWKTEGKKAESVYVLL